MINRWDKLSERKELSDQHPLKTTHGYEELLLSKTILKIAISLHAASLLRITIFVFAAYGDDITDRLFLFAILRHAASSTI